MTHTIRAYHKGKKVFETSPEAHYSLEEIIESLKPQLQGGSADFIEVTDHRNALKSRRIYPARRKR